MASLGLYRSAPSCSPLPSVTETLSLILLGRPDTEDDGSIVDPDLDPTSLLHDSLPSTEAELEARLQDHIPWRELDHGAKAIEIAQRKGLFASDGVGQWTFDGDSARKATR